MNVEHFEFCVKVWTLTSIFTKISGDKKVEEVHKFIEVMVLKIFSKDKMVPYEVSSNKIHKYQEVLLYFISFCVYSCSYQCVQDTVYLFGVFIVKSQKSRRHMSRGAICPVY